MQNNEARLATEQGIKRASDKANRVDPKWAGDAFHALTDYAQRHETFTIEQLREHLRGQFPDPPSKRAWGGVARAAKVAGIIEHHDWTNAKDPGVHMNVVRVWKSRIYRAGGAS